MAKAGEAGAPRAGGGRVAEQSWFPLPVAARHPAQHGMDGPRTARRGGRPPGSGWTSWALGVAVLLGLGSASGQAAASEASALADALIAEALPDGAPTGDGRALFAAVLDSPTFLHAEVGPFRLYVKAGKSAAGVLQSAAAGLQPVVEPVTRCWGTGGAQPGVISGRSHPIVLCESAADFDRALALLDRCEDLGFAGWKPENAVWTPANRHAEIARTWEVQLFNLSHPTIASRSKEWLEHGLGYYTLAHLVNRSVRQGAWGQSPPWFDQGLIDELDITAYGRAWVGGESWSAETSGWFRPGWSGFLPTGAAPPPPPTGAPRDLAVTVKKTGSAWDDRANSAVRHWSELAADRKSEAPASFAYMAEHQSFLPRDRAYARCALHLLLAASASAGGEGGGLLARLDTPATVAHDGMLSAEPLTVLVAAALGGVPDVDRLEAAPLADVLVEVGRPEIGERMRALGADGLLALSDHREQSRWLYTSWKGEMSARGELFRLILEAEHCQELREWAFIGRQLDGGMDAALDARKTYPKSEADLAKVLAAFRGGLEHGPAAPAPAAAEPKPRRH